MQWRRQLPWPLWSRQNRVRIAAAQGELGWSKRDIVRNNASLIIMLMAFAGVVSVLVLIAAVL